LLPILWSHGTGADVMKRIAQEAHDDPELLRSAPHKTPVKRVDEVRAAKQLVLCCAPLLKEE
ncbi:MAG TPA: hypothetical protein PKX07_19550, partial [Aggregatilineales bacterium]|nr:hypothetical protein [Aggregatilineales bacterium]